MASEDFYKEVYDRGDPQPEGPHGWIQWKGTEVCMDIRCPCGHQGHFDGEYFYHYECGGCHAKYAVGQHVKLIPLTEEQARYVERESSGFQTDTA